MPSRESPKSPKSPKSSASRPAPGGARGAGKPSASHARSTPAKVRGVPAHSRQAPRGAAAVPKAGGNGRGAAKHNGNGKSHGGNGNGKHATARRTGHANGNGHATVAPPAPAPAPERARRFVSTRVEVEGREETKIVELPPFEPAPWTRDAELHTVGARIPRADALAKVTGRARYTADVQRPGMLHAAIVRSAIARGRVTRLDVSPALRIPGVRAAVTRDDLPAIAVGGFPLLDTTVRYAGQPIAALCADTRDALAAALAAVVVEYDEQPHAVTWADALAPNAPEVRGTGNRTDNSPRVSRRGDVERGMREADVTVTLEVRTPVAVHTAFETHGTVAEWIGDQLTVWESTQGAYTTRNEIAAAFGLPLTSVRLLADYIGGAFGAKNGAGPHSYLAVALARKAGRPVQLMLDREAEQTDSGNRPAGVQRVTLGAKHDGTLTAIRLEATTPLGIGGWEGGPGKIYHEMYRCPNVLTSEEFVYINAAAMSSFRAPGHVEGAFGLERAMDALARKLGMDPLALRQKNHADRDQEHGRPYSAKHLDLCYADAAKRFGWAERERRRGDRTGRIRRGFGMASQIWGGGGGPPAYALVRLERDGTIAVLTGAQDMGTGSRTIFSQIAAEALGAKVGDVRTILGDTQRTPFAWNSWGSITTASVGPAVRIAAIDARNQLLEAASELMQTTPERLDARDSVVHVKGGRRSMAFREICDALGDVMIIGRGSRGPNPEDAAISTFGAQFAEVEVDVETGRVRVLRIVAAHDVGRIINPTLAESQLEGGIIQGLGYALFEERVMDRALGVQLNPTMHDYKIPTVVDIPAIDARAVSTVDTRANHTGAKGLAEPPIIPTAPAIANAVSDALGAEITEIPMTPWRVLGALHGHPETMPPDLA